MNIILLSLALFACLLMAGLSLWVLFDNWREKRLKSETAPPIPDSANLRLCINCKWHDKSGPNDWCRRPESPIHICHVTGVDINHLLNCHSERVSDTGCGESGKFFEPKA
jgi:hypothetical protein